jgi:glyceraldehyde 3-phosphate dehydrogenase/D-erythrose 4-phosphate dehydrogenase
MSLRIAINGYGRIGRCFLRALQESPLREGISIVAINEPADIASMAYLTQFDSTHGRFPGTVKQSGEQLIVNDNPIQVFHALTPQAVDWRALGIDLLIEASGQYTQRHELEAFLAAGCPRLLLSHPGHAASDVDRTVVFGSNHESLTGDERIVSAASCTTNAIVPVLAILDAEFGIEHALMTTLHSVMNDQPPIDGYHHADLRRTRSAMQSIIPVATGLARGVARLLPQLADRVEAKSIRVPVTNVSAIDLVATLSRPATVAEINARLQRAINGGFPGQLTYTEEAHASVDFNHSPYSAIIDGSQTRMCGPQLVNVLVWFDNEWGFANRMLELAAFWGRRLERSAA